MLYADGAELTAELIARPHGCGPDCLCWELRQVPAVEEALLRIGVPKYETINEAIEKIICQDQVRSKPA